MNRIEAVLDSLTPQEAQALSRKAVEPIQQGFTEIAQYVRTSPSLNWETFVEHLAHSARILDYEARRIGDKTASFKRMAYEFALEKAYAQGKEKTN